MPVDFLVAGKRGRPRNLQSLFRRESADEWEMGQGSYNSTKGRPLIARIQPGRDTPYNSCLCENTTRTPTCGGETSEIITNGTGPRPIANDLA
jgi:hypothetical protein